MANRTDRKTILMAILLFALISAVSITSAQSGSNLNSQIPFQGKLTDKDGKLLDGTVTVKVEIYDAVDAGTLLWSDTFSNVPVKKGIFSIYLGSGAKLTDAVAKDSILYAQVYANGDKLSPRIPIYTGLKVPSAGRADSSAAADSAAALSGNLDARKISGTINDSQISDLSAGKLSGTLDVANRIAGLAIADSKISSLDANKLSGTVDSKLSFKVSAGVSSVSDGATISFSTKSFGVSSFAVAPVVSCTTEKGYICSVASISTTNFIVGLISDAGNPVQSPTTKSVNWIAIGS